MTVTVTEAGYRRTDVGDLNRADPDVAADVDALREHGTDAELVTAPGKLALGLAVRRARGLHGLAVVPCDNVPDNGAMVARVVGELAEAADPDLDAWIAQQFAFVTTVVDRITPHATDDDRTQVRALAGVDDPAPVVTEPYVDWVLSGELPQGGPRWDDVAAWCGDRRRRLPEDTDPDPAHRAGRAGPGRGPDRRGATPPPPWRGD